MKLLSVHQIRDLDNFTIKSLGINSIELMERASKAVSDEIVALLPTADTKVVVFAGPGNNGGDGLAIARMLGQGGYDVEVYLFNTSGTLSEECQCNKDRLGKSTNVVMHEITSHFDLPHLGSEVWIIDALFGSGLSRPLEGGFKLLVDFVNNSNHKVISVDMPSGMLGVSKRNENETVEIVAVKADYTFTFHCLKPSMLLADNQKFLGQVKVLDIGLDDSGIKYENLQFSATECREAMSLLKIRDDFANKGSFGHGLLVAGSQGMAGASVLAGKSAYRSGLGKLSILTAEENLCVLQTALPEAVVSVYHHGDVACNLNGNTYSAVAIGPGLGQSAEAETIMFKLLDSDCTKMVIDADGLNILSKFPNWPQLLPKDTILTPHPKEWERLVGVKANRTAQLHKAMDTCQQYGIYIVLKDHYTAVCTPTGRVFFNTSGNSGMATAGSGDVLTGILLSLRSQGYSAEDACRLGVWLHGAAGDCAKNQFTEFGMMASDITEYLGEAFKMISNHCKI